MQKLAVLVSERFNGQITQKIYLRSYKYICALLISMLPSQNANSSPNGRSNDEASPFTSLNLICLNTVFYHGKQQAASVVLLLVVLFSPSILSNKKKLKK